MKHITLSIFISISMLSGCLFFDNSTETTELSKKEAKKRADNGDTTDYCERYNWYNDGTCDEFCTQQDSDCFTCDAQIACELGFSQVSACEGVDIAGYQCHEISVCGQTIYCEKQTLCAYDAIALECPGGYHVADACDESLDCISMQDPCGQSYFCVEDASPPCLALPSCENESVEVERCRLDDTTCLEVTLCGATIFCTQTPPRCGAMLRCAEDEKSYPSKDTCESMQGRCRQDYLCGDLIWCGADANCEPPTCDEGEDIVKACDDGFICHEEVGCGQIILCARPR